MSLQSFLDDVGAGAKHGLTSALIGVLWPAIAVVIISLTPSDCLLLVIIGIIAVTVMLTLYELQHLLSSLAGFLIGCGAVALIGMQIEPKLFATAFLQLVAIIVIKIYNHNRSA